MPPRPTNPDPPPFTTRGEGKVALLLDSLVIWLGRQLAGGRQSPGWLAEMACACWRQPKEAQNKIAINDRMSLESPWKVELVILQCFFEGRVGEAPTVGSMFILVHVHQKRHAVPAPRKGFRVDEPV